MQWEVNTTETNGLYKISYGSSITTRQKVEAIKKIYSKKNKKDKEK